MKEGNMKGRKKLSVQGGQRSLSSLERGLSKPLCTYAVPFRVTGILDP